MTDCEKYLEHIDAYVDETLAEPLKSAIEAHILECEVCGSLVKITRMMRDSASMLLIDPPEGFSAGVMEKITSGAKLSSKKRIFFRPFTLVAACAALALLAYSGDWLGLNTGTDSSSPAPGATMYSATTPATTGTGEAMGGGVTGAPQAKMFAKPSEDEAAAESDPKLNSEIPDSTEAENKATEGSSLMMALPPSGDQKLGINYTQEDAPLVKSADFARGYGFIATVTMPKDTFTAKVRGATLVEGNIYYLAVDSAGFDSFLAGLSTEPLTIDMYTKGVFVILGKPEGLIIITVE